MSSKALPETENETSAEGLNATHDMTVTEISEKQRRAARRTAFVLGLVALAIFGAFVASVVSK